MVEFAGNNQVSTAAGASPFFATAGRDSKIVYNGVDNPDKAQAREVATRMADIHDFLRSHMRYAQAKYIENADAHQLPVPVFQPGDMFFLDTHNMRTTRPPRKLDDRSAGPFRVL